MKPKKMKPVRAWAIVDKDGGFVVDIWPSDLTLAIYPKRGVLPHTDTEASRIARVEIREITKKK